MKQESLKSILHSTIRSKGYVDLSEVHSIAQSLGKKESNAERTLRPSSSPEVETQYYVNKDGIRCVKGYKWIGETVIVPEIDTEHYMKINNNTRTEGSVWEDTLKLKYPVLYEQKIDSPTQNKLF